MFFGGGNNPCTFGQERIIDGGAATLYEYDYDDRGRLQYVWEDSVLVAEYVYDANGNILDRITPGGTISGSYDDQDRQSTWGDFTFSYAAAGELLQKTDTTTMAVTSFDYDEIGSLLSVTLPGPITIDYTVDALGRRVARDDGVDEIRFLYKDRLNPVAQLDDQNQLVSRFVYAADADVPDYMVRDGNTSA